MKRRATRLSSTTIVAGALAVLGLAAMPVACKFGIDPNNPKGPDGGTLHFQCHVDADCGAGWVCQPQVNAPYGACYPQGACLPYELCNGQDDNCDGVVDNDPIDANQPCPVDAGACSPGTTACVNGALVCELNPAICQNPACAGMACDLATPSTMNCGRAFPDAGAPDGGDDAGSADAGLADAGPADGGAADAGPPTCPDAGPLVGTPACVPRETICDDCLDNDGDGLTDCADPDCAGKTCAPGMTCKDFTCQ